MIDREHRNAAICDAVPQLVASWTKPGAPKRVQRAAYKQALEDVADDVGLSVEAVRRICLRAYYRRCIAL